MKKLFLINLVIFILLASCGKVEEKTLISVYDTDQYQTYKRLTKLARSSSSDNQVTFKDNITQMGLLYSVYELSDLKIMSEESDENITNYLLYIDGEYLTTIPFRNCARVKEELTIYYIDITGDLKKDVVMICEPPPGTVTSPYWSLAYDVYNNRKIGFFDEEAGELTQLQKEQLHAIIEKDDNFKKLFPTYRGMGEVGAPRPLIDRYGEVYYEMAIWGTDSYIDAIGSILVMFKYDKDNNSFDVNEILYMPQRVHKTIDY